MTFRRLGVILTPLLALTVAVGGVVAPLPVGASTTLSIYPRNVAAPAEVRSTAARNLNEVFSDLVTRSSKTDPYFWNGRVLTTSQTVCFRCEAGPAVLAAAAWRANGTRRAAETARRTFNVLISQHRSVNGSFGPPMGNEGGPDIQTALFANELGQAYLMLRPVLTNAERSKWAAGVVGAADWLIKNGNLKWYTNGNIVLANALTMLLASKMSNRPRYFAARYDEAMRFVIAPPQNRWKGFGFVAIGRSKKPDGSDGKGYLAESGGGVPGLDIDYLQMQANVLAWMYWVSPTTQNLRLLNMETNLLFRYVDNKRWNLQTAGGTRHPSTDRRVPFDTSSLPTVATRGGRIDYRSQLRSYLGYMKREWWLSGTFINPGTAYSFGSAAALGFLNMASAR